MLSGSTDVYYDSLGMETPRKESNMDRIELNSLVRSVERWHREEQEELAERRIARARLGLRPEDSDQEAAWLCARGGVR